jgi:RNA-directed DNA polymerase
MLNELTNEALIDNSFSWLCKQRKHFPANSDVWDLRFHWHTLKPQLINDLLTNRFTFRPLQKISKQSGEVIHLWTSVDCLVLKMLATLLAKYLPASLLCTHLKGHGGAKQTVTAIQAQLSTNTFVFRTDVKSYYESINHELLLSKLAAYVKDKVVMNLLGQYLKRSVECGGLFTDITQGISSGCPLSPLMSSFYLYKLDKEMESKSVFYRRYMDDIIVLSPTRWKLRKAIRTVNQHFAKLTLHQHPDKTTIGRIKHGFDFLGYQFGKEKLTVSKRTLENHIRRLTQLYEQKKHQPNWQMLLDDYRQHWVTWVYSGIPSSIIDFDSDTNFLRLLLKSM